MLRSLSVLGLGSLAGAGAAFLTQVLLARHLAPADFGALAAVLAAIGLVAPLAAFGVGGFWLKAFGEEGWAGRRWVLPAVRFALASTLAVTAGTCLWGWLGPHDPATAALYLVLSVTVASTAALETASAVYQLEERYARLALWQLAPHVLRLAAVGLAVAAFGGAGPLPVQVLAGVLAAVALVPLAFGAAAIGRVMRGAIALQGHGPRPEAEGPASLVDPPGSGAVVRAAWPFGLAGLLHLIYFQSDVVLLKYLVGDAEAGLYNVAFVLLAALYRFPSLIYQRYLLPKIHRWASHDRAMLRRSFDRGNRAMAALGLAAMAGVLALGPWAIAFLFGAAFAAAAGPLAILAFAVPLRFVATSVGAVLVTQDHMRRKVRDMGVVAVANVAMNLVAIPAYGITGAAVTTVVSEALLLALYWRAARTHVFGAPGAP